MTTLINKPLCKKLRIEINEALRAIGKANDLNIECGNMSYSDEGIKIKVNALPLSADGAVITEAQQALELYSSSLNGLTYGDTFTSGGILFMVTGYKPRSSKYNIVARNTTNNKEYGFSYSDIKHRITYAHKAA